MIKNDNHGGVEDDGDEDGDDDGDGYCCQLKKAYWQPLFGRSRSHALSGK